MTPDDLERAKRHVRHVWEFFYHLMTYVLVNAILVIVDRLGGTSERAVLGLDWASWLIIAWGFGILGHAIYASTTSIACRGCTGRSRNRAGRP
jgi:hypothetical protein